MEHASLVIDQSRNPYWNLAVEEALLESVCRGYRRRVVRVWINRESVVIGRGLKACEEVNCREAERLGIPIVRRTSGGGAVYHDGGNLNITLIEGTQGRIGVDEAYRRGLGLVVSALRIMGLEPWIENGNDVVVTGWKVSGTAVHVKACAYLFHSTMLVESDMDTLKRVIKPRMDRVLRGEVTPAKYNPGNLSDIAGITLGDAISSVLQAATRKWILEPQGLERWELEYSTKLYKEKYTSAEWNLRG